MVCVCGSSECVVYVCVYRRRLTPGDGGVLLVLVLSDEVANVLERENGGITLHGWLARKRLATTKQRRSEATADQI